MKHKTICWPYVKPRNNWSGRKQGKLKFLFPIYKELYKEGGLWYYLCECVCGKEKIVYARTNVFSCGCSRILANRKRKGKKQKRKRAVPVQKVFNKIVDCFIDKEKCKHYDTCYNERLVVKKMSARWIRMKGKCYER